MSRNFLSSKQDLPDPDSPRPNLADFPRLDAVLAIYDKALSELDTAISSQREFASDGKSTESHNSKSERNKLAS